MIVDHYEHRVSRSGVVHRAYVAESGRIWLTCRTAETPTEGTRRPVSCKRCLAGGSAWVAFVAEMEESAKGDSRAN